MTERKVINKYFPPDYDPAKIPRMKRGYGRRQFNIRTMAPFNMRCLTCNGYIYKAKKFNSRMETAENVDYLGLRHYRFFIRCPSCCAEIIWRTDLESGDYVLEGGAKRNFEALKTAEELEAKRQAEEEEELANNPMKMLEKRTDQSKQEMEMVEVIEDLKLLNERQAGMEADHLLLRKLWQEEEAQRKADEEADERLIKELLASRNGSSTVERDATDNVEVKTEAPVQTETAQSKPSVSSSFLQKRNPPHGRGCCQSYLKRQLKDSIIVKRSASTVSSVTSSSSHLSSPSASNNVGPSEIKHVKQDNTDSTPKEGSNLLGITYSDSD